ncbi:hypothetical protein BJV74DRAFT_772494 [Russula compacta]|nr:hypothetical protein BJV74DRAFT_772494 [Russula compacta]
MRLTQIHRFPERLLSTVHRGTAFEYRALALLTQHLSMSLTRVGGSHDGGVDLIGWWWVPQPRSWDTVNRRRLRVLAQCKAEKRKMGPAYLRELEGVVYRYANTLDPSSPHVPRDLASSYPPQPTPASAFATRTASDPPVALLVSESAFTRNCLHAAHASPLPFLLVHLPSSTSSTDAADAPPGTVFGNPALVSARGVLGGEIEIRWEHAGAAGAGAPSEALGTGRPGLWWQGRPLPSWTPDADSDAASALFNQG